MRTRAMFLWLAAAVTMTVPGAAWEKGMGVQTRVHEHEFDRVELSTNDCELTLKLLFTAPAKAYKSRAKVRNSYLFKARAKFKNGKELTTKVFRSRAPARRSFTASIDTSDAGCWAKNKKDAQVTAFDVVGCRGKGCAMPELP